MIDLKNVWACLAGSQESGTSPRSVTLLRHAVEELCRIIEDSQYGLPVVTEIPCSPLRSAKSPPAPDGPIPKRQRHLRLKGCKGESIC
jgi:hypothetical protein